MNEKPPRKMRSVLDHMTDEQRVRFEARVARERARPKSTNLICSYCDKVLAEVLNDALRPAWDDLVRTGALPIPNFGWFCSHTCADAYEADYGIRFQRDASGIVSY